MTVSVNSIKDVTLIEIEGAIDSNTAPHVQQKVLSATVNQHKVILDMTNVEYLSSAGLRMLLLVYRQLKAQNGNIALVGLSEEIKDVMTNTGFIDFFIVADSRDSGMIALNGEPSRL